MMKPKLTLFVTVLAAALFGSGCASTDGTNKSAVKEKPTVDPLKNGLVAYYPFNGNSLDESGNGNHGGVNGARFAPDRNGRSDKAYSFDGKSWVELPANKSLQFGANDFTFCAWFNTSMKDPVTRSAATIVAEDDDKNPMRNLGLTWMNGNPRGVVWVRDISGELADPRAEENNVADSRWHQLIGIRSGSTVKLAIDGKIVSVKENPKITSSDAGVPIRIGTRVGSPVNPFIGSIDDVRIYNRALSAEEVKALYDLEKPKGK